MVGIDRRRRIQGEWEYSFFFGAGEEGAQIGCMARGCYCMMGDEERKKEIKVFFGKSSGRISNVNGARGVLGSRAIGPIFHLRNV